MLFRGERRRLVGIAVAVALGFAALLSAPAVGVTGPAKSGGAVSKKRATQSRSERAKEQRRAQQRVTQRTTKRRRKLARRATLSSAWGYGLGADPKFTLVGDAVSQRTTARVNVANGNVVVSALDLPVSPFEVDMPVYRWMNGLDPVGGAGSLGRGAQLSVGRDVRLETVDLLGSQVFTSPSGAKALFPKQGLGYGSWRGGDLVLDRTLLGYHVTETSGVKYSFFAGLGTKLESAFRDASARWADVDYDLFGTGTSVWDERLRRLRIDYAPFSTRTAKVRAPGGAWVAYDYSGSPARLSAVRYSAGGQVSVGTDPAGRVTSLSETSGEQVRMTYDGSGRTTALTITSGGSERVWRFTYGSGAPCTQPGEVTMTRVTGPDGAEVTYCAGSDLLVRRVINPEPPADEEGPQVSIAGDLSELGANWTRADSGTVSVSATDAGSGVTRIELRNNETVLGSTTQACPAGGCALSDAFVVDLDALGEGTHTLTVRATDVAGNHTLRDLVVRADRAPPQLDLSGSLVELQDDSASGGSRVVNVSATDSASGVVRLTMTVDGTEREQAQQPCDSGGCSQSATWTLDLTSLGDGTHEVTISAYDRSGRETDRDLTVRVDAFRMPPVPALSETEVEPFSEQVDFLWNGPQALQTGYAENVFEARRVAVITGRVFGDTGLPAGGVKVSVPDHPEFGRSLSRSDGKYYLAVNGGQEYRVRLQIQGSIDVERRVTTPWNDYAVVDDVQLTALDTRSAPLEFGAAATEPQTFAASTVSDGDGTRTVRLFIRPGTQASVEHTDGDITPLTQGTVRVTEFTVGESGPRRMPAALPEESAYTWAADYRIDEASGPDVRHVRFSKPVVSYIENFVDSAVGMAVPVGTYETSNGRWAGQPDGRVIKIVSISPGGRATIDVTGYGPANADELQRLDIDDAELDYLGASFQAGAKIWRAQLPHFSTVDKNHAWLAPVIKCDPSRAAANTDPDCEERRPFRTLACVECLKSGSIIGASNQSLGEVADLGGTPYGLRYSSTRTPGARDARAIKVPITGPVYDESLMDAAVDVQIAGQRISFLEDQLAPDLTRRVYWDGKDAFGRPRAGGAVASVTIHYRYPPPPYSDLLALPAGANPNNYEWVQGPFLQGGSSISFGRAGGSSIDAPGTGGGIRRVPFGTEPAFPPVDRPALECADDGSRCWYPVVDRDESSALSAAREARDVPVRFSVRVPYVDQRDFGVGGWGVSDLHRYDPATGTLFTGSGDTRAATDLPLIVKTVRAGDQDSEAGSTAGSSLDVMADGSLLRTEPARHRVVRDWPDGRTTVFAGSDDRSGSAGDGGQATAATLSTPTDVAVGPDGSVFIIDATAGRVRRVAPNGVMSTYAGKGSFPDGPNPQDPLQRYLISPSSVAAAPDGTVYIGDEFGLLQVSVDGVIARVGGADPGLCKPGGVQECSFVTGGVRSVATAPDGTVYWVNYPRGVSVSLNSWKPGEDTAKVLSDANRQLDPEEGPISEANIDPRAIEVDDQGQLWLAGVDPDTPTLWQVWRMDGEGIVAPIGLDSCLDTEPDAQGNLLPRGEGGPFVAACGSVGGIAQGPDGVYVMDAPGAQVRRVTYALANNPQGAITVPSEDGSEAYRFSARGRHLDTRDGLTGRVIRTFSYDANGRVTAINETDFGATTFVYGDGGIVTVTGPDGQQTRIETNSDGYATRITDAADASQSFAYTDTGLMTSRSDELDRTSTFEWNAVGHLLSDVSPDGGTQRLSRQVGADAERVTHRSATNQTSEYRTAETGRGDTSATVVGPDGGTTTQSLDRSTGRSVVVDQLGNRSAASSTGDPRWGGNVQHGTTRTETPGGLATFASETSSVVRAPGANLNDPFDFQTLTDTFVLSGATETALRARTTTYSRSERISVSTSPMGRSTTSMFDERDLPTMVRTPGRSDVTMEYDGRGRLVAVQQEQTRSQTIYGADGRVSREVGPNGGVTRYTRDATGRPVSVEAPDGAFTELSWDDAGQLTRVLAPDGRAYTNEYDSEGRLIRDTRAARSGSGAPSRSSSASYDAAGRITQLERPSGSRVSLTYDEAGRFSAAAATDGTRIDMSRAPVVDGKGGQIEEVATDGGTGTRLAYDGGLIRQTLTAGDAWLEDGVSGQPAVRLDYDAARRLQAMGVAGQETAYEYNDDDQMTRAGPVSVGYDVATGDPTRVSAGVTTTDFAVDGRGLVSQLSSLASAGAVALSEAIVRDSMGRVVERREADSSGVVRTYQYAYDQAGQLTGVLRDGVPLESFTYDVSGALIGTGGLLGKTFAVDGSGRATAVSDGRQLSWSSDGELERIDTSGGATELRYDGFGRIQTVTFPDGRVGRYRYDGLGHRVAVRLDGQLVRRFVYGPGMYPLARVDAAGDVIERYVYGTQEHVPDVIVRRDGQQIRLVTDALGSVRLAIDADSGAVLQRLSYGAYGDQTENTNPGLQPFGFKGSLADPVAEGAGLVWMGVRAYVPSLARFATPDPAGLVAGWNEHDAFGGDPINMIDADGMFPNPLDVLSDIGEGAASVNAALMDGITGGITQRAREALWGADGVYCESALREALYGAGVAIGTMIPLPGFGLKGTLAVKAATISARVGALGVKEGVYILKFKSGKQYVGQSADVERRLKQHLRSGRFGSDEVVEVQVIAVKGGKTQREVAEQKVINKIAGRKEGASSNKLYNKRNPIGPKREHLMK